MSASRPPRVALFLLTRFAVGARQDALVGDLLEQFAHGRSRVWFWRQTFAALATSVALDLRAHKWVAARAVVMGWAGIVAGAFVANQLTRVARGRVIEYFSANGIYSADLFFWSSHIPSIALSYAACAICGYLVARLHRRAASAFLVFAATVFLFEYGIAAWMLASASSGREGPRSEWVVLLALIGRPIALLAGGLLGQGAADSYKFKVQSSKFKVQSAKCKVQVKSDSTLNFEL